MPDRQVREFQPQGAALALGASIGLVASFLIGGETAIALGAAVGAALGFVVMTVVQLYRSR